jgi:hypothetical protein
MYLRSFNTSPYVADSTIRILRLNDKPKHYELWHSETAGMFLSLKQLSAIVVHMLMVEYAVS